MIRQTLLLIWEERCEKINKWEQKHNITNKMKRDKSKWTNNSTSHGKNKQKTLITKMMKTQIKSTQIFFYAYKNFIDNIDTSSA